MIVWYDRKWMWHGDSSSSICFNVILFHPAAVTIAMFTCHHDHRHTQSCSSLSLHPFTFSSRTFSPLFLLPFFFSSTSICLSHNFTITFPSRFLLMYVHVCVGTSVESNAGICGDCRLLQLRSGWRDKANDRMQVVILPHHRSNTSTTHDTFGWECLFTSGPSIIPCVCLYASVCVACVPHTYIVIYVIVYVCICCIL